jgi:chromosome segregation ATPase
MLVSNPAGALRKEGDGWKRRVNDLIRAQSAEIARIRAENEELRSEHIFARLESEIARLRAELAAVRDDLAAAIARAATLDEVVEAATKRIEFADKDLAAALAPRPPET